MELNEPHTNHEHASVSLKIALLIFAIVLVAALGYLVWTENNSSDTTDTGSVIKTTAIIPTASWKTYTNSKYSYSIKYSPDWTYREYPDTANGAAFRLAATSSDPANDLLSLGYMTRSTDDQALSFDDYVKVAAIHEIENFQKLITIEKITTASGVVGYKTTWEVAPKTGSTTVTSAPIYYFPLADGKTTGTIELSTNVQATPLTAAQLALADQMAKTLTLQK